MRVRTQAMGGIQHCWTPAVSTQPVHPSVHFTHNPIQALLGSCHIHSPWPSIGPIARLRHHCPFLAAVLPPAGLGVVLRVLKSFDMFVCWCVSQSCGTCAPVGDLRDPQLPLICRVLWAQDVNLLPSSPVTWCEQSDCAPDKYKMHQKI